MRPEEQEQLLAQVQKSHQGTLSFGSSCALAKSLPVVPDGDDDDVSDACGAAKTCLSHAACGGELLGGCLTSC